METKEEKGCKSCETKKPLFLDFKNGNFGLNLSGIPLIIILGGIAYGILYILFKLLTYLINLFS